MNLSLRIRPVLILLIVISGMAMVEAVPSRQVEARCPKFPQPCRYDPSKEDPPFFAEDDRVNPMDPIAPMTAYCKEDHSIDVWGISGSEGKYLFTASAGQIVAALQAAARNGKYALVGEKDGRQLVALSQGDLLLHDAGGYDFRFSAALCGFDIGNLGGNGNSGGNPAPAPASIPNAQPAVAPTPKPFDPGDHPVYMVTTRGRMNVRVAPNTKADIIGYLPNGVTVTVNGRDTAFNWLKISYNGLQGWVVATHFGLTYKDMLRFPAVG